MQVMSSAGMPRPPMNPRTDMDNKISAAVEAGSISETDATALESALDTIDSSLKSGSTTSQGRLDPSAMKDRIDSLISDQVDAGTLTEDQAAELQALFAQGPSGASASGEAGATESVDDASVEGLSDVSGMKSPHGPHGPHGAGGPPPPRSSDDDEDDDTSDSDTTDDTTDALLSSIQAFVENLRSSLTSGSTYSAVAGSSSTSSSGLIVDQLA